MEIKVGAISHIGKVKKSNQDRVLVRVGEWNNEEFGFLLLLMAWVD